MKHLIVVAVITLFLFSCKKETSSPANSDSETSILFFKNVKAQLKDSLPINDYASIDTNQLFKSKDAHGKNYFVRVAFQKKSLAGDFILLKTDSLGNISLGKIIHVDKSEGKGVTDKVSFQGKFVIQSLNRNRMITKEVVNGRWKENIDANSKMAEEPAGEQTLPDVVVTSYSSNGSFTGNWYWLEGFGDEGNWNGGNDSYTYVYAGGGGGNSSNNDDNAIDIKFEPNDDGSINVSDYIKCFSSIPDANATYKITIMSDLPVNGDPTKLFDWSKNSPGHSFIQLNKSGGGQIVQQNFGFYPEFGWKAPFNMSVDSKVVDNAGHEFNASLSITVSGTQFQAALNKIQSISANDYNITTWNCTDFALSVFNAASSVPLTIPKFAIPTSEYPLPNRFAVSNTPQGLYEQIQMLQNSHNTSYGTTDIPGVCGFVGSSHGSCK